MFSDIILELTPVDSVRMGMRFCCSYLNLRVAEVSVTQWSGLEAFCPLLFNWLQIEREPIAIMSFVTRNNGRQEWPHDDPNHPALSPYNFQEDSVSSK